MSVGPNCPNCGGELQASWKVCPLCGTAIANDEPVNAVSPPILGLDNPFADSKRTDAGIQRIAYPNAT